MKRMREVGKLPEFSEAEHIMFRRLVVRLGQAFVRGHDVRLNEWEVDGVRRVLEAVGLDAS